MEAALTELDRDTNCPEGISVDVWQRMCQYRRVKVESERLVQTKALTMAEMQAFVQKRHDEDEKLFSEIEDINEAIQRFTTRQAC